jgi:hypothetical protein
MNSKKAKQMRRMGRGLTKKDKKLYNSLSHDQKGVLSALYQEIELRNKAVTEE